MCASDQGSRAVVEIFSGACNSHPNNDWLRNGDWKQQKNHTLFPFISSSLLDQSCRRNMHLYVGEDLFAWVVISVLVFVPLLNDADN